MILGAFLVVNFVSKLVRRLAFPIRRSCVMLPHEFLPIHQSFARDPCDRWADCCAAGDTGGGKAAACGRDDGDGGDVGRHALLSGQTAQQPLPGLSACCAVHADDGSSRTAFRQWHPGPALCSHIAVCCRRRDWRRPHRRPSGPSSSTLDLIGVPTPSAIARLLGRADNCAPLRRIRTSRTATWTTSGARVPSRPR